VNFPHAAGVRFNRHARRKRSMEENVPLPLPFAA